MRRAGKWVGVLRSAHASPTYGVGLPSCRLREGGGIRVHGQYRIDLRRWDEERDEGKGLGLVMLVKALDRYEGSR